MVEAAKRMGIELFLIDRAKPLEAQGPYNAIVHKLSPSKEWECELQEFASAHPDVRIIDSVRGIRTLRNRATMLSVLSEPLIIPRPDAGPRQVVRVQAPVQVDVPEGMLASDAQALVSSSGLSLPLLVKPMWTDGREGSHGLAVVTDYPSLGRLLEGGCSSSFRPPVVVQEYVEHGGVLHKVYVLGDTSVVCRRASLSDKYLGQRHGVLQLPRISCKTVRPDFHGSSSAGMEPGHSSGGLGVEACMSPSPSSYDVTLDSESEAQVTPSSSRPSSPYDAPGTGMFSPSHVRPPDWVTQALAGQLRSRLGMELFNFDLIVPTDEVPASADNEGDARSDSDGSSNVVFYVVDINYFPGVDKIPNFEQVFLGFLRSACLDS